MTGDRQQAAEAGARPEEARETGRRALEAPGPGRASSAASILMLQRAAGNRATAAWLQRSAARPHGAPPIAATAPARRPRGAVLAREPAGLEPAPGAATAGLEETVEAKAPAGPSHLTFKCVAPMALGGPLYRDAWGILAHAFLSQDYKDVMKVPKRDVYLDDSFAGPVDPRYAAFLIRKNPSLPSWAKVFLALTSIKRADVVLHDATRQEFEEFKPDNALGIAAGLQKLLAIRGYVWALGLPYTAGTSYTPTPMTRIFSITLAGVPVELWLAARRDLNGLVVYKYCIKTDWGLLLWSAVIAAIILAIYLILKGKVPAPSPPDQPTPELPPPNPIPIPVPPKPIPVPKLDMPMFGLDDELEPADADDTPVVA